MTVDPPSTRQVELVEAAYAYALEHGLAGASLRPVAEAIGSSTGVLRFLFGSKDGLVHISQLASARVQKTSDVVKEGDKVKVKLLGFDDRGKTRLSMRAVDQTTGEDLEAKQKSEAAPREAAGE